MIVDAHSHVFPEPRGQVREGPTRDGGYGRMRVGERLMQLMPPLNRRTEFTTEMLLANLDWAGVDAAVLLQGTYYGECDGYVAEAVAANPGRLVGALWCDPWRPGFRRYFEEQVEGGAFRAGKIEFSEDTGLMGVHPGARLDDEEVRWLWPALESRGMVLTLDLGPPAQGAYQTAAVRAIAEAHEGCASSSPTWPTPGSTTRPTRSCAGAATSNWPSGSGPTSGSTSPPFRPCWPGARTSPIPRRRAGSARAWSGSARTGSCGARTSPGCCRT